MWVQIKDETDDEYIPNHARPIFLHMPLTAADGILLLVGAQEHEYEEPMDSLPGLITLGSPTSFRSYDWVVSETQNAMYRIRRDQLDAYLAPRPRA